MPHGGRVRRKRETLSERQNHRCCYCGVRFVEQCEHPASPTIDHLQTRKDGGRNIDRNLVVACRRCNGLRDTERPSDFFARRGWEIAAASEQKAGRRVVNAAG